LFLPAGAAGPAFLLSANYWVLKEYNISDSERIDGKSGLRGHWPEGEVFLSRIQKSEVQRLLERLGFYHGIIDGRFGHPRFQINAGIFPADGFARADLLRRMSEEAERRTSQ
jgi:membrane-bound lytic murein transglycosylase B